MAWLNDSATGQSLWLQCRDLVAWLNGSTTGQSLWLQCRDLVAWLNGSATGQSLWLQCRSLAKWLGNRTVAPPDRQGIYQFAYSAFRLRQHDYQRTLILPIQVYVYYKVHD